MKNNNFLIFDGNNTVITEENPVDMAARMILCGMNDLELWNEPVEKIDVAMKKAKKLYERQKDEPPQKWGYEHNEYMKEVYKATELYIDGLMTIWDAAGEGAYKHSEADREFRDAVLRLYDYLRRCKNNLRREERLKKAAIDIIRKKGVTADGGAGAAADA